MNQQQLTKMLTTLVLLLIEGACLAIVVILIWGWIRWLKRPKTAPAAILSFIAFVAATMSVLLAISTLLYAQVVAGFPTMIHGCLKSIAEESFFPRLGFYLRSLEYGTAVLSAGTRWWAPWEAWLSG